jgi:tRNA threonylcarbamoyladenosine dehydratase
MAPGHFKSHNSYYPDEHDPWVNRTSSTEKYATSRFSDREENQASPREPTCGEQKAQRESMSSWLQRQASSHSVQLAATAVLSGVAVAGAIYGYQSFKRAEVVEEIKASIPPIDDKHFATKVCLMNLNHVV